MVIARISYNKWFSEERIIINALKKGDWHKLIPDNFVETKLQYYDFVKEIAV